MSAFFNLASFALGLAAWAIALAAIIPRRKSPWFQCGSFTCCGAALVLQFFEIRHRCLLCDFAAIDDTIRGISLCAVFLLAVTLVLNAVALMAVQEKMKRWIFPRNLTAAIILLVVGLIAVLGLAVLTDDGVYPYSPHGGHPPACDYRYPNRKSKSSAHRSRVGGSKPPPYSGIWNL